MNDTPLVTIEQSLVLRLSVGEAGALLGSLDRSAITGTPVARVYDALAEAARYCQRGSRITPIEMLQPIDKSQPPQPPFIDDPLG